MFFSDSRVMTDEQAENLPVRSTVWFSKGFKLSAGWWSTMSVSPWELINTVRSSDTSGSLVPSFGSEGKNVQIQENQLAFSWGICTVTFLTVPTLEVIAWLHAVWTLPSWNATSKNIGKAISGMVNLKLKVVGWCFFRSWIASTIRFNGLVTLTSINVVSSWPSPVWIRWERILAEPVDLALLVAKWPLLSRGWEGSFDSTIYLKTKSVGREKQGR